MFTGPAKGENLAIGKDKAYFTKDKKGHVYDLATTVHLIEDVIDNAYVQFGGSIYRQTTGVPMGSNCSPMLADLALTVMEHRYVMNAPIKVQKRLIHVRRYIDDILVANCPNFTTFTQDIYPRELILKRADNPNENMVPFLDLHINRDTVEIIDLYDKTRDFNFDVVKFTHISANVPPNTVYQIYNSQLVRISRIITVTDTWYVRVAELTKACVTAGASSDRLANKLAHFMRIHDNLLWKYGVYTNTDRENVLEQIMNKT
jgi:hypothetical protein